jgi:methyl-accepting chemotaxis protein
VDELQVSFDEEWAGYDTYRAFFINGDTFISLPFEYAEQVTLTVPWEVLQNSGKLYISFVGLRDTNKIVTRQMERPLRVDVAGVSEGKETQEATKDEFAQLVDKVNEATAAANDASDKANTSAADVNEAVSSANDALTKAQSLVDAASDATNAANVATEAANKATTNANAAADKATSAIEDAVANTVPSAVAEEVAKQAGFTLSVSPDTGGLRIYHNE